MKTQDHHIDELIEIMWLLREEDKPATTLSITARLKAHHASVKNFEMPGNVEKLIQNCAGLGLIQQNGEAQTLTEKGAEHAEKIIRRHRLAENLFHQIMEIPIKETEAASCEFEHILSDVVVDKVCSFLGHPRICPHNKKIPQGSCCNKLDSQKENEVSPLMSANPSDNVLVSFISSAKPEVIRKLATFGIIPGKQVQLIQKGNAIVISVDQSTIAIDKTIAECIFVKQQ